MIYKTKPENFNPQFEVASCFIEFKDEILLLYRQDHKPQGNTWGLPAGKKDDEEPILKTLIRETYEETGISLLVNRTNYEGKLYVKYGEVDFIYHSYKTKFNIKPPVRIRKQEHKAYSWETLEDALKLPLIEDLDKCIEVYYK